MPCSDIENVIPVIHPSTYVHPNAILISNVIIGPGCYVGPCASMREDFGRIVLHEGANVQDDCVMNGFPGHATVVEANGHIGHGAVLQSCVVRRDAMVGMYVVVMDDTEIGKQPIIAACTFVSANMFVPPRTLVTSTPAKVRRELQAEDIVKKLEGTRTSYQDRRWRCLQSMREDSPLSAPEPAARNCRRPQCNS